MEGEKGKLKLRIEEREVRRKIEGDRAEDQAVVEREATRVRGLLHGDVREEFAGMRGRGRVVLLC